MYENGVSWENLKKELLAVPGTYREYKALEPEYEVIRLPRGCYDEFMLIVSELGVTIKTK